MVKVSLSRFVHDLDLGEHIAVWHSLRLRPVFLTKQAYHNLQEGLCEEADYDELKRCRIITTSEHEDDEVLAKIQSMHPGPGISLGYFILSERCNLACKYCFVGEHSSARRCLMSSQDMTEETAEKALHFFIKQLEGSGIDFTENKSQLIFFGGEPLIGYDVLVYVARRVHELSDEHPVLESTGMTVITNGTLLTEERLLEMKSLGVSVNISIDGSTRAANSMRVYPSGREAYDKIIEALDLCKRLGMPPSLSITLSEQTIEDLPGLLELLQKYDVRGLGYNILLSSDDFELPEEYYEKASQFIIDSFEVFRKVGIYEDRIMRKLNCFANAQIYFSDCGATAGGQLVFTPDGRVGVCQGLIAEKEFFVTDLNDAEFDATKHPVWQEWATLSPLNNPECFDCEALGICGGGCPVNARALHPERGLNCKDERQCVHAKKTLEYLIGDLYRKALKGTA